MIPVLKANIPYEMPPSRALWQRKLIEALDGSVYPFLQKYTHEDGTLIWKERWDPDRDGVDDIYESFYNWPLLYLLGGGDHLLTLGLKEWEALTRQLTAMGPVYKEYERENSLTAQTRKSIWPAKTFRLGAGQTNANGVFRTAV